jgi:hypothetical protein
MIFSAEALPSTPIELVNKLTEQETTPGTLDTAFSTRALQAAQLIPVTKYCSILNFAFLRLLNIQQRDTPVISSASAAS